MRAGRGSGCSGGEAAVVVGEGFPGDGLNGGSKRRPKPDLCLLEKGVTPMETAITRTNTWCWLGIGGVSVRSVGALLSQRDSGTSHPTPSPQPGAGGPHQAWASINTPHPPASLHMCPPLPAPALTPHTKPTPYRDMLLTPLGLRLLLQATPSVGADQPPNGWYGRVREGGKKMSHRL